MSNHYFQFKQFTVHQDKCAMKVCTDACLFGAWVAERIHELSGRKNQEGTKTFEAGSILDIGTGTGILSLMLAQKSNANIEAIEIDEDAFQQAKENIASGKFASMINVIHGDARKYNFQKQFDLVVSNPPFFENDLRSADIVRSMAKHDESLTFAELFHLSAEILSPGGLIAVLVSYPRTGYCKGVANAMGFHLYCDVSVKQSDSHDYFRSILVFGKHPRVNIEYDQLVIKEGANYSPEFVALLKDYYLYL